MNTSVIKWIQPKITGTIQILLKIKNLLWTKLTNDYEWTKIFVSEKSSWNNHHRMKTHIYATYEDLDATFSSPSERSRASSTESDVDNRERPKKRFKRNNYLNKHKSRDISKSRRNTITKIIVEPPKFVNIQKSLENMNGQLIELSKSTAKLEQEIALLRDSPALSVRPAYTSENRPSNYKGSGEIRFTSADKTVTVPAQNVEDALVLNEILNDKKSFEEVVSTICFF